MTELFIVSRFCFKYNKVFLRNSCEITVFCFWIWYESCLSLEYDLYWIYDECYEFCYFEYGVVFHICLGYYDQCYELVMLMNVMNMNSMFDYSISCLCLIYHCNGNRSKESITLMDFVLSVYNNSMLVLWELTSKIFIKLGYENV